LFTVKLPQSAPDSIKPGTTLLCLPTKPSSLLLLLLLLLPTLTSLIYPWPNIGASRSRHLPLQLGAQSSTAAFACRCSADYLQLKSSKLPAASGSTTAQ
jgi:hypothetical protein